MFSSNITTFAAEETSGIAALGIDGRALLIQLITFILVFVVLRRFAFKPILKVLNERRQTIDEGVILGEQMRKERAELDKTVENELRQARLKADSITTEARDTAKQVQRDAEATAHQKAENIVADAHVQAEQDAARTMDKLRGELGELLTEATEAVADVKLDTTKDAALIDKALRRSTKAAKA